MRIKISNWALWSITFVVLQQFILTNATPIPIKNDDMNLSFDKRIIEVKKFAFSPESEPVKREEKKETKKRSPIFRFGENYKNYFSGGSCEIMRCRRKKRNEDGAIHLKKRSPIFSSLDDPTRPSYDSSNVDPLRRALDDLADGMTIILFKRWWWWKNSFNPFMPGSHNTKRQELDDLIEGMTVNLVKRGGSNWWLPQKWMFGHRKREDLSNLSQESIFDAQRRSFDDEKATTFSKRWSANMDSDDKLMKQKRQSNSNEVFEHHPKLLRRDSSINDYPNAEIDKRSPISSKLWPTWFAPPRSREVEEKEPEMDKRSPVWKSSEPTNASPKRDQVVDVNSMELIKRELSQEQIKTGELISKRSPIFNPKGTGYYKTQNRKNTKREDLE